MRPLNNHARPCERARRINAHNHCAVQLTSSPNKVARTRKSHEPSYSMRRGMCVEHVTPRASGGKDCVDNAIVICCGALCAHRFRKHREQMSHNPKQMIDKSGRSQ